MCKKSILLIPISFFILTLSTQGFFEAGSNIDLYNTIANWYEENANKNYEFELSKQGKETISANVSKIIKEKWFWDCIKEWLDAKKLTSITTWDMSALFDLTKEECKSNKSLPTEFITVYAQALIEIEETLQRNSRLKTKKTYDISRIGLYSDGNTKNSPFDLVDDIKQIEKIIFSEELEYKGEIKNDFEVDFSNNMAWIPLWVNGRNPSSTVRTGGIITISWSTNTWSTLWSELTSAEIPLYIAPGWYHSNYICSEDTSVQLAASGFSQDSIDAIMNSISTFWNSSSWSSTWIWNSTNASGATEKGRNNGTLALISTWYKSVNDNPVFPCSTFFCITIEMVVHNQNLLWGGNSWTIESILKYSNETLKKFANTSLLQAKMTTNNFEMWLLDLKLPDMFHMGVQIQKRSPPILNIENPNGSESSEKKWDKGNELTWKNLLEEAYKSLGLEYKKSNSLDNFLKTEPELKSVLDSAELPYTSVNQKLMEYNEKVRTYWESSSKNAFMEKSIEAETEKSSMDILKNELIEIEKFGEWLKDYSETLTTIIKWMNKVPINK